MLKLPASAPKDRHLQGWEALPSTRMGLTRDVYLRIVMLALYYAYAQTITRQTFCTGMASDSASAPGATSLAVAVP